ncbi:MAG: hypothetical protein E7374_03685 [Clostridiales bacterium]|nr:hypothetical protein [Clostridiales bacterium]
MKRKIEFDVYEISKRIKEIDRGYYIVYDTLKDVFEIHNSLQKDTSYCLTLPYKQLDNRTLKYVCVTKSSNIEKIIEKIDNDNKVQENADKIGVFSQCDELIEEKLKEE